MDASRRATEQAPGACRITPYRDGPLLVRGPFKLVDADGNRFEVRRRTIALCRCGRSRLSPFCDGTHKIIGFRAEGGPGDRPGDDGPGPRPAP